MRTFLLLIFISVFSIFAGGQENKDTAFLQISIEIKENKLCFGHSADIIARLTNNSRTPVVIDPIQIGGVKYFDRFISKYRKDPYDSTVMLSLLSPHYKPNFIILQPNESLVKNLKVIFDNEFFKKAGRYQIEMGYEQLEQAKFENIAVWLGEVDSNKVNIFIRKCSQNLK